MTLLIGSHCSFIAESRKSPHCFARFPSSFWSLWHGRCIQEIAACRFALKSSPIFWSIRNGCSKRFPNPQYPEYWKSTIWQKIFFSWNSFWKSRSSCQSASWGLEHWRLLIWPLPQRCFETTKSPRQVLSKSYPDWFYTTDKFSL